MQSSMRIALRNEHPIHFDNFFLIEVPDILWHIELHWLKLRRHLTTNIVTGARPDMQWCAALNLVSS